MSDSPPSWTVSLEELVANVCGHVGHRFVELGSDVILHASVEGTKLVTKGRTALLDALLEYHDAGPAREGVL